MPHPVGQTTKGSNNFLFQSFSIAAKIWRRWHEAVWLESNVNWLPRANSLNSNMLLDIENVEYIDIGEPGARVPAGSLPVSAPSPAVVSSDDGLVVVGSHTCFASLASFCNFLRTFWTSCGNLGRADANVCPIKWCQAPMILSRWACATTEVATNSAHSSAAVQSLANTIWRWLGRWYKSCHQSSGGWLRVQYNTI